MKKKAATMATMAVAAGMSEMGQSAEQAAQSAKDLQNAQQMYEGPGLGFYEMGRTPMTKLQKKRRKKAMLGRKANCKRLQRQKG